MSRKAGTPNKPKVEYLIKDIPVTTLNEPDNYIILHISSVEVLCDAVNRYLTNGYECQGGASVTNYRADNGSIVMVYCQALVRKDMV